MDAPAKRILYVEGNIDHTIGGSYYSLFYLVSSLDRRRFEPIVVFATDNALITRFSAHGVRTIVRSPSPPTVLGKGFALVIAKAFNFLRGWILEPMRIALLLRGERVAIVHLNNSIISNHPWMIGALFAGIPCISHERGINRQFQRRARLLARGLAAVICISKAVHDNLIAKGLGHVKLITIHNGLDPAEMRVTRSSAEIRAELGVAPTARLIGVVGNIKLWKGQEVVIRAMTILRDRFPDVVCLLIGDTSPDDADYRKEVFQLITQSGLDRRVLVTGFRADVANYINALEIQVHPSVYPEPFGRVLLEGMALSKPLIASNDGAVPEIVVDGETGLLFEPESHESLARQLISLLTDPQLSFRMGQAGYRRLSDEFSIIHNVSATESLYQSLLGS